MAALRDGHHADEAVQPPSRCAGLRLAAYPPRRWVGRAPRLDRAAVLSVDGKTGHHSSLDVGNHNSAYHDLNR